MGRGVAAVVDAIFLLLIAMIASGIVMLAASNYGKNFNVHASKLLLNYYAKQVVRTLVTASIYREPGIPDYLLSYLKENVELLKNLGSAEEKLKEVVEKAMYPIKDRYDYTVMLDTLGTSAEKDIGVYMIYKITEEDGSEKEGSCSIKDPNVLSRWTEKLGEVYTSATTIFLRFCTSNTCYYIPTDIRVTLFPRATAQRPC